MQDLTDFMKEFLDYYFTKVHTSLPGVVIAYDASKRRAIVQPSLKRRAGNKEYIAFPLLIDVPVVKAFLGDYSEMEGVISYPYLYWFWFLRDLFILNIFFAGIKKLVDNFPLGTLVLFFILWTNNIRIYIVSPEALLFFTLGYYIVKYNIGIKNVDQIKIWDLSIIYGITIILEYFFIKSMPILHKVNIIDLFNNRTDDIMTAWEWEKRRRMPERFFLSGCTG